MHADDSLQEQHSTVDLGFWELDIATDLIRLSREAQGVLGLRDSTASGDDLEQVFGALQRYDRDGAIEAVRRAAAEAAPLELRCRVQVAEGDPVAVRISGRAVVESGQVVKVLGSVQRVSDEDQRSLERLRFATHIGGLGEWELDLVNHTAYRSLLHDRIFGYEELLPEWTYELFLEHVHPYDRAFVDEQFNRAIARNERWNFRCRIFRADGELRWIWAAGRQIAGQQPGSLDQGCIGSSEVSTAIGPRGAGQRSRQTSFS